MRMRMYLDVYPWSTATDNMFATNHPNDKSDSATRYAFDVEVPDPNQPDVALPDAVVSEVTDD